MPVKVDNPRGSCAKCFTTVAPADPGAVPWQGSWYHGNCLPAQAREELKEKAGQRVHPARA